MGNETRKPTKWEGWELHQSVEELFVLADLIESREFEAIVEVGAPSPGLVSFLLALPTKRLVLSAYKVPGAQRDRSSHRPSEEVTEILIDKRTLVYLTEPKSSTAFAWASMLSPGSVVIARNLTGHDGWPDFGYVTCTESRLLHSVVIERQQAKPVTIAKKPDKRRPPRRPIRSVFLGDLSYCSAYRLGVTQGMSLLGAWHRDVNIRDSAARIDQQVREMRPEVIFTHMLLWPPANKTPVYELLDIVEAWRREWGASVVIHDGDPRVRTRFPHDVSNAVDLALLNHTRVAEEWNVPTLHWPYAAFVQNEIGKSVPALEASLVFAGLMREEGDIYGPRTSCVRTLIDRVGLRLYPGNGVNNRMQVADVVASCDAVIGFGRPEAPGWIDTRVFSVPGAGGVLIHDDVGGILVPNEHYIPCKRYDVDSILEALEYAREHGDGIRSEGFEYVQSRHTYKHRCQRVLDVLFE